MNDIDKMIEQLLDMEITEDDNEKFKLSEEQKEIIHEIAERCNEIPIVSENKERAEQYGECLTAEQVYIDMLDKIVNAPTRIHMRMSARMLIPVMDKKLQEEERTIE